MTPNDSIDWQEAKRLVCERWSAAYCWYDCGVWFYIYDNLGNAKAHELGNGATEGKAWISAYTRMTEQASPVAELPPLDVPRYYDARDVEGELYIASSEYDLPVGHEKGEEWVRALDYDALASRLAKTKSTIDILRHDIKGRAKQWELLKAKLVLETERREKAEAERESWKRDCIAEAAKNKTTCGLNRWGFAMGCGAEIYAEAIIRCSHCFVPFCEACANVHFNDALVSMRVDVKRLREAVNLLLSAFGSVQPTDAHYLAHAKDVSGQLIMTALDLQIELTRANARIAALEGQVKEARERFAYLRTRFSYVARGKRVNDLDEAMEALNSALEATK